MTTEPTISITGVAERDIDLLLLEEFVASNTFARRFGARAYADESFDGTLIEANRSVTQSIGESDLEIVFRAHDRLVMLLIENKIGAGFQPRQAERYRERGESYMETGRCHSYRTILVAPSTYLGESPDSRRGFDAVVTYEEIGEWIDLDVGAGRTLYKRALLGAAIQKATLGYQPDEDAPVTAFWRSYWELAKDIAPDLVMNEPGPKPGGSSFVYFRSHQLPAGVRIVHKMVYGNLDLQFGGMAGRLGELRANYQQHLIEGMTITTAAKSGVVRQKVPPVDPSRAFELQEEEVRTCLSATAALLAWYEGVS